MTSQQELREAIENTTRQFLGAYKDAGEQNNPAIINRDVTDSCKREFKPAGVLQSFGSPPEDGLSNADYEAAMCHLEHTCIPADKMMVIDSTSSTGRFAPTHYDAVPLEKVGIIDQSSSIIASTLDALNSAFQEVNLSIHSHPELAYQEVFAHGKLTDFLEHHGFQVKRHAWGLDTAFEATFGCGGRQVVFCAEYDALPGIGHGCGHNLIATSSLAAFLSAARALQMTKLPGRLRIIGTPAEEGGGGKIKLLEAGAFDPPQDIAAALMSHPTISGTSSDGLVYDGIAGTRSIAAYKTKVIFKGRASHAGAEPWNGFNALDAAVAAYVNVSMLRQQIRPDERVHGVFEDGGTVPNIIPQYTRMNWCIRSPTLAGCQNLVKRVHACFEAGAAAANCKVEYET